MFVNLNRASPLSFSLLRTRYNLVLFSQGTTSVQDLLGCYTSQYNRLEQRIEKD